MSANLISAVHDLVLESGLEPKTLKPPLARSNIRHEKEDRM